MRLHPQACLSLLLLAVIGCAPKPPAPERPSSSTAGPITDRDWVLVALGERPSALGSENRPITLRLEAATARAAGFAGCNRYSAGFTLSADTLKFGPAISTKMACGEADELERSFLAILPAITTYQITDSTLTLQSPDGPLATFRAR